jgi:hypothetical protein
LVIVVPRTGTTPLQRTPAVDPQFSKAQWWETRYPAPWRGETPSSRCSASAGRAPKWRR